MVVSEPQSGHLPQPEGLFFVSSKAQNPAGAVRGGFATTQTLGVGPLRRVDTLARTQLRGPFGPRQLGEPS